MKCIVHAVCFIIVYQTIFCIPIGTGINKKRNTNPQCNWKNLIGPELIHALLSFPLYLLISCRNTDNNLYVAHPVFTRKC